MKIAFIGLGNMAEAMIGGILNSKTVSADDITGSNRTKAKADEVGKKYGIRTGTDNNEAIKGADYIILAVKPQMYEEVLGKLDKDALTGKVLISIAPGRTIAYLKEQTSDPQKIVRVMPNTPALVGEGCSGVCRSSEVTSDEFDFVLKLLNSFGKAYEIKETQMDAVVAVSGSSPAYVFMMIEAMADGAVAEGLDRQTAYKMAAQSVLGSARMVLETGKHPGELKDMVCSPGGTTIKAVKVLEETGFRSGLIDAMEACAEKSRQI